MSGFIYLRSNESYDEYNAYKLGKTLNIREREDFYTSLEISRGFFVKAFELEKEKLDEIENKLQKYLKKNNFHIFKDGGNSFFDKKIIDKIKLFFENNKVYYKELSNEEINLLTRI
jgi:hypothetical protein